MGVEARIRVLQRSSGNEPTIRTLFRDGHSLRQRIQFCRSILSPMRRIPPEILSHIFEFTLPTIQEARAVDWDTALESSPWVLGQISRRWRAVALASPTLWTTIMIRNTEDSALCSLPMLETQLLRSAKFPLDIFFDHESWRGSDEDTAEEAWKALRKLPNIRGRVPLLEKVCVWGRGTDKQQIDDGSSDSGKLLDHLEIAPRLRDVEVDDGLPFFEFPWAQVTRFKSLGPWEGHINSITRLKNVESCSLMIAYEHEMDDPYRDQWGSRTCRLPRLRQLELCTECTYNPGDPGGDWSCPTWLVAPALTDLAIASGMLNGLLQMLQVSKCTLRKLHLNSTCPDPETIRPVFESNPDITELLITLQDRFPSSHAARFIPLLACKPRQPTLLPKLDTLVIKSVRQAHEEALGDMLISRWRTTDPAASRLRSVPEEWMLWFRDPRVA
ncbi:hypothetical protein B0H11DRAFT_2345157 [Mycena galericulata]|nr:hypothetical protein B0H11DRAFT_2345157 [Mycena galericulata]